MVLKYILAVLLSVVFVSAQETFPGLCYNATTMKNFDVKPYLGRWYEIKRYEAIFEQGGECSTADYSLLSNGSVEVRNSFINKEGNYDSILGNAYEENPELHDGKLNVIFPSVGSRPAPYWVLGTDYKNFSVVWSCIQFNASLNFQFAWVLSRTPTLSQETADVVNDILIRNKVDQTRFRPTKQDPKTCANKPNHGSSA